MTFGPPDSRPAVWFDLVLLAAAMLALDVPRAWAQTAGPASTSPQAGADQTGQPPGRRGPVQPPGQRGLVTPPGQRAPSGSPERPVPVPGREDRRMPAAPGARGLQPRVPDPPFEPVEPLDSDLGRAERQAPGGALMTPELRRRLQEPVRPVLLPPRVGIYGDVRISLEGVIARVLANNKDILTSILNRQISVFQLDAARGFYDPLFGGVAFYESAVTPIASIIGGVPADRLQQHTVTAIPEVTGFFPNTGGSYRVDFVNTRFTTNNEFVRINPQFPTAMTFSFIQPLWRNFRIDEPRRQIEVARANINLSDSQFRQQVMDSVTSAEVAYWDLVFAVRDLAIQTEAANLAREQLESNQRLVREGALAPLGIVEAETQLAVFEQNVYAAQEFLTRTENVLKTLMLPFPDATIWWRALVPVTRPNLITPDIAIREALERALLNRPELRQAAATARINRANVAFLENQTQPQIDLTGTYIARGLAGTPTPVTPSPFIAGFGDVFTRVNQISAQLGLPPLPVPADSGGELPVSDVLIGGYPKSLANLFAHRYPTFNVGIQISVPFRNTVASANLGQALTEGFRIRRETEQLELRITADVRDTMQAVRSADATLIAARRARGAAELQYQGELRRFQGGLSTVFLVLDRQTEMIVARSREARAESNLSIAIARFQRALGMTLAAHDIRITDATRLQLGRP